MNTAKLLKDIAPKGINIWVEGDNLKYEALKPLPDSLISELKEHKDELLKRIGSGITGYQCDCGNTLYQRKTFRWQDLNGQTHFGYSCKNCMTQYWFV